jgi:hypothetical protein
MNTATVEVKERPAIFSGAMVKEILAGNKSQTRRVMKLPPRNPKGNRGGMLYYDQQSNCVSDGVMRFLDWKCPYGQPGERLWVRETWADSGPSDNRHIVYRADYLDNEPDLVPFGGNWTSPIFMYRPYSRINLEIVNVRVERLQEISADDCASEGIQYPVRQSDIEGKVSSLLRVTGQYPPTNYLPREYGHNDLMRAHFASGWNELNAKRGFSWESNPFVWVITFKKL